MVSDLYLFCKNRTNIVPLSSVVERYTSTTNDCVTCSGQPFDSASGKITSLFFCLVT